MTKIRITPEVTIYNAGGKLSYALYFAFFFLLLLSVTALMGAIWLVSIGQWLSATLFVLIFLASGAVLFVAGLFLFSLAHTEIQLRAGKATFVLPNWRGPTPMFPYGEYEVPYADIAAIELRGEVYRYFSLPVIVKAVRCLRKDGGRLTLGYVHDAAENPAMPLPAIAAQIAGRARVPLNSYGMVEAGANGLSLVQNEPVEDAPELSERQIEALRAEEHKSWYMAAIAGAIVTVVACGFLMLQMFF
ncbi:MAG: hypothetical protein P8Y36_12005 [Alphaproteobacteria bacterium]